MRADWNGLSFSSPETSGTEEMREVETIRGSSGHVEKDIHTDLPVSK